MASGPGGYDPRKAISDALASANQDPFIQYLEKERAAGREYGDSPEFLKAMKEGRMKPYPGAPPGTMSIDGIAPPPLDWKKLIESIPPDVYMSAQNQAPSGPGTDFVPPGGLTPNMHEALQDRAMNGPAPAAPSPGPALRDETFNPNPPPSPEQQAASLFYGGRNDMGPRIPAELLLQDQPFAVRDALRKITQTGVNISNPYDPSIERALGPRDDEREATWQRAKDFDYELNTRRTGRQEPNAPLPPPRPVFPGDAAEMQSGFRTGPNEPMLQQPGGIPKPPQDTRGAIDWLRGLFGS